MGALWQCPLMPQAPPVVPEDGPGWKGFGGFGVIVAGAAPVGMMLAGDLVLAGVDVQMGERRFTSLLVGMRARGFHSGTLEILDGRGIAGRFLAEGPVRCGEVLRACVDRVVDS
jgi:hypothetical protein